jgi:RimJ/RimL family protein N-acetyltransferase
MESNEVIKRLNEEIIWSISEELNSFSDKKYINTIIKKIAELLGNTKFGKNFFIDKFEITKGTNKDNERLFYVKGSFYQHNTSAAAYYAFNSKGEYVGCVKTEVLNLVPPTQVEMEYWANEEHKNKGNMTVLARDVINDIFENRAYDGFKIRDGIPTSNIDSIMVAINKDNYPSLAVARKLGFDENGILHIDNYYKQIEEKTSINK